MTVFPLLAVGFFIKVVAAVWFVCALALVLIILVQKGKGGGLSAAFGGGMAGGILGTKTGDFLTWVTIVLVGVFITFSVVLAKFFKPAISDFGAGQTQLSVQQPPVQREQPIRSEQPSFPAATSDTSADANSPGVR